MPASRPVPPAQPRFYRLQVSRREQLSPAFVRVTVTGPSLAELEYFGFDHWFRLFLPAIGQEDFRLPSSPGRRLWYAQYLAIPSAVRPHLANYTIREFRADSLELDIDVVIHTNGAGEIEGRVAQWASRAVPGESLAILDQGLLFHPPTDSSAYELITDESGLPAVEGILRSMPREATGRALIEVPADADRRELARPAGVAVHWVVRDRIGAGDQVPGRAVLAELDRLAAPDPRCYAFAIGESELATGARRLLIRRGVPKDRISFCGFWKH